MKNLFSFLLFLGVVSLVACKDDDTATPDNLLIYDNGNVSGPLLDAGEHELAVRFPASTMAEHVGKKLTEMQVFVGGLPQSCSIRVYGEGDASTPGDLKYNGNVINSLSIGEWNKFKITPAIEITGEDLWLNVNVVHAQQQQSIGCDAGPRRTNGDWLLSSSDQLWRTYQERTGEAVNWNIRGKLE